MRNRQLCIDQGTHKKKEKLVLESFHRTYEDVVPFQQVSVPSFANEIISMLDATDFFVVIPVLCQIGLP